MSEKYKAVSIKAPDERRRGFAGKGKVPGRVRRQKMAEIMNKARIEEWIHQNMGESGTIISAIALGLVIQLDENHFAVPYTAE